jgi:polysaccharide export outer membrane protein
MTRGSSIHMQKAKLRGGVWCLVAAALLVPLALSPASRAQAGHGQPVLETPQQVNDRIRELSATLRMMPHDYVIGAGDLLSIYVFDVQELSREVRVSQTGTIGIPLVPVRLHVAGLTELQVEQKIAEVLEANGLVTHADVSVSVKEHKSKPITIVGAVPHPMVYEADRQVTLLEVLAEAGGISNDAGDTVIISRSSQDLLSDTNEPPEIGPEQSLPAKVSLAEKPRAPDSASSNSAPRATSNAPSVEKDASLSPAHGLAPTSNASASADPPPLTNIITVNLNELMETGDTKNNIPLQAGDIVTVPHAGVVYVLGAVGRAGGYVLSNDRAQLTTLKILSLAGGLTRTAKSDKAVIVRKDNLGQQHEVSVDLKKVLNRKAEDLQLQPSDILYVPESGSKQALFRAVEFGLALGSGVALYRIAYH